MKTNFKATAYSKTILSVFIILYSLVSPHLVNAEEKSFIPVGKTVAVTVSINGVSVVNTAEFETSDGSICSPAADAGILAGDRIIEINGNAISSAASLEEASRDSADKALTVICDRDGQRITSSVIPKTDASDGKCRLGVWIKDSASGIGTLTYIDPQSGNFGALGHGICTASGSLIDISAGNILDAEVTSVKQGEKGSPGELIGIFSEDSPMFGKVEKNTDNGIFGHINDDAVNIFHGQPIPVADRSDVSEGDVTILSNIEGNEIREYSAEITKINDDEDSSKGMIVKITDSALLEKTGGIVQGMSGSPIIQNGKLIGAVTHVFINNPTRGYGIFIDKMIASQ